MNAVIIDTETTGLPLPVGVSPGRQPRVIELAALSTESGQEVSTLIDPGCRVPDIITKITGISTADVKGKPRFHQVWPEVQAMLEDADCLVAHNLSFDRLMLELESRQNEFEGEFRLPAIGFCTVEMTEHIKGYRLKLGDLYEMITGEKPETAHRAIEDVRSLAACWEWLVENEVIKCSE